MAQCEVLSGGRWHICMSCITGTARLAQCEVLSGGRWHSLGGSSGSSGGGRNARCSQGVVGTKANIHDLAPRLGAMRGALRGSLARVVLGSFFRR